MSILKSNHSVTPFLWFNGQAEEAMKLYTSLFPNSEIKYLKRWGEGSPFGANNVMMGAISIDGMEVKMFDAGPEFTFNESVSFFVTCQTQKEIDKYWNALIADGGNESQCGWLKDKFGFSWQIVPAQLGEWLGGGEPRRSGQMFQALMKMRKLVIADLQAAYDAN